VSLASLGLLLGFWAVFGAFAEPVERIRLFRIPLKDSLSRLLGLPRTIYSTALAHLGLGLSVLGIVAASAWQSERVTALDVGGTTTLAGYTVTLESLEEDQPGPNFAADRGTFLVTEPGGETRRLVAERRVYLASGQPTTEAAIETYGLSQLYIQLGENAEGTSHAVRVWHKPFVTLIWLGTIVMAGAGVLSLSDRRLRVGAPKPARARPVPAE
jgi:cytochrome c-type biogenesis protein CcmF